MREPIRFAHFQQTTADWLLKYNRTRLDWTNSCQIILDKQVIWLRTAYPCCFFDNVVPRLVWKWHVFLNQSLHDNWILQTTHQVITIIIFVTSHISYILQNTWSSSQKEFTYSLRTDHVSNCLVKSVNLNEGKINKVHNKLSLGKLKGH